jgi:S-(hydroxymethyl)glutathione dehydrogenase/alcohol dehydrogenase
MAIHTEAAVLRELGRPLEVLRLDIPTLRAGQVLVDIAVSGVCHSQLHEIKGRRGEDKFLPHVLGHEASGVVREVGPAVTKVAPGDRVVLTWIKTNGIDVPNTTYGSAIGSVNSGAISTLMRATVVAENRLVKVSDALSFEEAALLGCAVPTGAGALINAQVERHPSVVVWGAGGVGLSAILAAQANRVPMIIVVDISPEKLSRAREFGATHLVNAKSQDPLTAVREITQGRGASLVLECVGRPECIEQAFACTAYGGGECIIAGNPAYGEKIHLDPFDLIKGRTIRGTWGGDTVPDRDIPIFAKMCIEGSWDIKRLVSHSFALEEVNQAFDALERGDVARAIVRM